MTITPGLPNLSDPNRCASTHWHLPAQCELPPTHRDNWHQTTHPETGNPLRYRPPAGTTEEQIHGQWHQLIIPKPVRDEERKLREEIAAAIDSIKQDYPVAAFTALVHAEQIARGPLLREGKVTREVCGYCEPTGDADNAEQ